MQDRPTAKELLKAARSFCEDELGPALDGRLRFQVRVLQNILGILEREWDGEEDAVRAEYERLRTIVDSLDVSGDMPDTLKDTKERVREANVALAKRIRAGEMDERFDDVLDALYDTIREKLQVANPNWF